MSSNNFSGPFSSPFPGSGIRILYYKSRDGPEVEFSPTSLKCSYFFPGIKSDILKSILQSFINGKTPFLPAGTLIQARVGWYRLLEDVGLFIPEPESRRMDRTKIKKRRILNEVPDEREFYEADIPARPLRVEEFDTYHLVDFENLFRDRSYADRVRKRSMREIPRLGAYTKLSPDRVDLQNGRIPILTNRSFFTQYRFPRPAPGAVVERPPLG